MWIKVLGKKDESSGEGSKEWEWDGRTQTVASWAWATEKVMAERVAMGKKVLENIVGLVVIERVYESKKRI
jgi:hypothetical protein